jgi:hypothetical protein
VYTHEFVHSLVTHGALMDNSSEWFQEGLATYYQSQIYPQANLPRMIIDGIEKKGFRTPLPQLLDGRAIPMTRYWQALTVIELLLTDAAYRAKVPELIAAFQKTGSTDLGPHLESVLKTTWDEFTGKWEEHCRRVYGRES